MRMKVNGIVVYKIHDHVYQRAKMHSISLEAKAALFEGLGISIVVGLAPAIKDKDLAVLNGKSINYFYAPIPDGILHKNTILKLHRISSWVASVIRENDTGVLCHCNGGRNRAGLMNALILMKLLHCSGEEALEIVRRERPNAVATPSFDTYLKGLV